MVVGCCWQHGWQQAQAVRELLLARGFLRRDKTGI